MILLVLIVRVQLILIVGFAKVLDIIGMEASVYHAIPHVEHVNLAVFTIVYLAMGQIGFFLMVNA